MPPAKSRKRKSDQVASDTLDSTEAGTNSGVPNKKRKMGITLAQKQALVDNLQLEITERARRLRAQYSFQAQGLRSRLEIRINRIPTALRKSKMGDLLLKHSEEPQRRPQASPYVAKPPPVPAKDNAQPAPITRKPVSTQSSRKRVSDEAVGGDKENEVASIENPKKRLRGGPPKEDAHVQPGKVLSPASSNSRIMPRDRPASPTKSMIARPVSPLKPAAVPTGTKKASSSILSNMVEKAKATRAAASSRKATTSSTASSNPGTTTATRTRRAAAAAAPAPTTRGRRKISLTSESSEASTGTVIKRSATTKPATVPKKTMMSSLRKGVSGATTKKATATKAAPASATTRTTRTLRKRN